MQENLTNKKALCILAENRAFNQNQPSKEGI